MFKIFMKEDVVSLLFLAMLKLSIDNFWKICYYIGGDANDGYTDYKFTS